MTFIRIRLLFKFVDAPARALWLHREKKSVQSSGIKRMWRKAFRISWKKVAQNTYILYECTDCTYSMCAQIRTLEWTHAASHKWLTLRDRLICSVYFLSYVCLCFCLQCDAENPNVCKFPFIVSAKFPCKWILALLSFAALLLFFFASLMVDRWTNNRLENVSHTKFMIIIAPFRPFGCVAVKATKYPESEIARHTQQAARDGRTDG